MTLHDEAAELGPLALGSSEGLGRTAQAFAQMPLFDDSEPDVEERVQAILAIRRRTNSSGQGGEDIANIRTALVAVRPNVAGNRLAEGKSGLTGLLGGPTRSEKE